MRNRLEQAITDICISVIWDDFRVSDIFANSFSIENSSNLLFQRTSNASTAFFQLDSRASELVKGLAGGNAFAATLLISTPRPFRDGAQSPSDGQRNAFPDLFGFSGSFGPCCSW
jgi:hypothetical protein